MCHEARTLHLRYGLDIALSCPISGLPSFVNGRRITPREAFNILDAGYWGVARERAVLATLQTRTIDSYAVFDCRSRFAKGSIAIFPACRRVMSSEAEFQRQNERFELLLNLVTSITSSLDIREVLRAIAANIVLTG